MAGRDKLFSSIVANPKSVRFGDACKPARQIGFVHQGGKGSHFLFKRKGEPVQLNFQDRGGFVPPYQARQLVHMLDKYGPMP